MEWRDFVVVDPDICHGRACFKGTRVFVSVILDNLAAGESTKDIIASYPTLTEDAVRAAIAYAADLAREQVVALPA